MFEAGEQVRLENDPAVVGIVTDRPPEERAGRTFFQIELPTGRRSLPANQLEHVLAAPDALVDLLICPQFCADTLRYKKEAWG